nr:DUF2185 domain-containing protein [Nocardioides sp.]
MSILRRRKQRPVDFVLGDAELRHAEAPRSFFIPSEVERRSLHVGDLAKLMFEVVDPADDMPSAERMWVEVTEVVDGAYVGHLANEPTVITTVAHGDLVRFGPEHIIQVPGDWDLLDKRAFVSLRSHADDLRPGYVYREAPDDEGDSGWRALVGDETDEETNDPHNILIQPLGFLLDRWPELRPLLESEPDHGAWEWDNEAGLYIDVTTEE